MKDHEDTMEKLEKLLSSEKSHAKVIYVPGGSDPEAHFKHEKHEESEAKKSLNLHMETHLLAEGLLAVGLGGSVPAYFTSYPPEYDEDDVVPHHD